MSRWRNRAEMNRLRCRATEYRNGRLVQFSEDRRTEHNHQFNRKAFGTNFSMPTPGSPTVGPANIHNR